MKTTTDEWHIERVLAGDTAAFSHLVQKYQTMVFSIAIKVLPNQQDAEDVAQETFLKAFQSLAKFNRRASFSTWLYTIAYRTAIDRHKKRKGRWENMSLQEDHHDSAQTDIGIEERLGQKEIQAVLRVAIARLPPDDQILITLYYYDELPLKEIAVIMTLEENNLKIRLFRIRNKLLGLLKKNPS